MKHSVQFQEGKLQFVGLFHSGKKFKKALILAFELVILQSEGSCSVVLITSKTKIKACEFKFFNNYFLHLSLFKKKRPFFNYV